MYNSDSSNLFNRKREIYRCKVVWMFTTYRVRIELLKLCLGIGFGTLHLLLAINTKPKKGKNKMQSENKRKKILKCNDLELAFVNFSFLINFVEYFIYKTKYIIID